MDFLVVIEDRDHPFDHFKAKACLDSAVDIELFSSIAPMAAGIIGGRE